MQDFKVHVVGSGLAGSEAAYFLAEQGISVVLHEMRPSQMTSAHQTALCAELVCSNSFKSKTPHSAPGMLKTEMSHLQSLILRAAGVTSIPGGEALVVDRQRFSETITRAIRSHSDIQLIQEEVTAPIPGAITLFTTGPLTSPALSTWITKTTTESDLYFYDAIAPIVEATSIDQTQTFLANRYGKGDEEAYVNCPLNESEYQCFYQALLTAEKVSPRAFEKEILFQSCQPIESIASTGIDSLRFGPMKPVGLFNPRTKTQPYAVVQLRPENETKTGYNLVGFQTKLKYHEQNRIFRLIPGLQNAEFLRLGSMHRNTYLRAPQVLRADLSLKGYPMVYFAGQITGVEGYLESAATGLLAALFIQQRIQKKPYQAPPAHTALGALLKYVVGTDPKNYTPSHMHFGLFDPSFFENIKDLKKDEMRKQMAHQAHSHFMEWHTNTIGDPQP